MSFVVFVLIFAFIVWQRLSKSRRPAKDVQSEAGRTASPLAAFTDDAEADDAEVEDIATDVAGLVSNLLGQNSQELIGQAVSRAIQDSKVGAAVGRGFAEAKEPIEKAVSSKRPASQAHPKQRAKYLLDGDGGYRQRTDRTVRLQQSFGGKGLCSPRQAGSAKPSRGFATGLATNK